MPELPEVETVKRGIEPVVLNRTITNLIFRTSNLRTPLNHEWINSVIGSRIISASRRSKYLVLNLDNKNHILIHLGMSGRLQIKDGNPAPEKHDHVLISLDSGKSLYLNDARKFGLFEVLSTKELDAKFAAIGPEPFDDVAVTPSNLNTTMRSIKSPIKTFLLDQRRIAGIGNIYASEALFKSHINPTRSSNSIDLKETTRLIKEIRSTLEDAIKSGGSSLKDHRQANGKMGYFQHNFKVYGREGDPCYICENKIKRITQGGRSTFYCETCQK